VKNSKKENFSRSIE